MNDKQTYQDFVDRLAEIVHYVILYGTLPSIRQTVSAPMLRTEALALSMGYVEQNGATFAATTRGRLWLAEWAEAVLA